MDDILTFDKTWFILLFYDVQKIKFYYGVQTPVNK
jgi:hypothetical protein